MGFWPQGTFPVLYLKARRSFSIMVLISLTSANFCVYLPPLIIMIYYWCTYPNYTTFAFSELFIFIFSLGVFYKLPKIKASITKNKKNKKKLCCPLKSTNIISYTQAYHFRAIISLCSSNMPCLIQYFKERDTNTYMIGSLLYRSMRYLVRRGSVKYSKMQRSKTHTTLSKT